MRKVDLFIHVHSATALRDPASSAWFGTNVHATTLRGSGGGGLGVFSDSGRIQLGLVRDLLAAIESGNLERAKNAYVEARPPYEQIEVLAASFEQTDRDIDARPAGFDGGELNREFKGFHRIEALLYRDENIDRALRYARRLVRSVRTLRSDLNQGQNFNATMHFEGMMALATEVSAKKICGEEETWSDQSLLISKKTGTV